MRGLHQTRRREAGLRQRAHVTRKREGIRRPGLTASVIRLIAADAGGEADLGPALKGEKEPSHKMVKQIREGSGRMAPIGEDKLPEAEMKGLLVYLASIDAVGDIKAP